MSLVATARAAVEAAFDAADDVKTTITLKITPTLGAYIPASDSHTITWGFNKAVPCIAYDDSETAGDIANAPAFDPDVKLRTFLVKASSIGAARPENEDQIVDEDNVVWGIWKAEVDPSHSIWTLNARNPIE